MVAYWVARAKVNNPDEYKKYTDLVPGILEKFGGKILARGGKFKILEGPEKFHRFIVIEFPSFEKAVGCHDSPEYLEARRTARRTARASWRSSSSRASEGLRNWARSASSIAIGRPWSVDNHRLNPAGATRPQEQDAATCRAGLICCRS